MTEQNKVLLDVVNKRVKEIPGVRYPEEWVKVMQDHIVYGDAYYERNAETGAIKHVPYLEAKRFGGVK
jgi:hypothetical protein